MATVNTTPSMHRTIQVAGHSPAALPNNLNSFFSRFEANNTSSLKEIVSSLRPDLCFSMEEVVRALKLTKVSISMHCDAVRNGWGCVSATVSEISGHQHSHPAMEALHCGLHPEEDLG